MVSITRAETKRKAKTPIAAYTKNVIPGPHADSRRGKVRAMIELDTQYGLRHVGF